MPEDEDIHAVEIKIWANSELILLILMTFTVSLFSFHI